jgi:membrane associated rhomboid family serine protease
MGDIFSEINRRFNAGTVLARFIYINVGVFLVMRLLTVILRLFMVDVSFFEYLHVPSSWTMLLYRPWTIFTYMFVHLNFLHLFFNMLWLYWFGKLFLRFFYGRRMGVLYVLGGFAGGLMFVVAYNLFPFFKQQADYGFLAGASASVMAIVFAVSFYQKDYMIQLFLLGRVKLIYLAIGVLLLDLIAITSDNAGGHIAHIGGALLGICYAGLYEKRIDLTFYKKRMIGFFTRKPSFKVHRERVDKQSPYHGGQQYGGRPETDDEYLRRKNEENRIIDDILDKLKHSGYESLSAEEKKQLFNASKK